MTRSIKGVSLGAIAATMFLAPAAVHAASGHEKAVLSFYTYRYYIAPNGGLVHLNGNFYGTTAYDSSYGAGAVYQLTPSGKETVLYNFYTGTTDGNTPMAGLVNVNGVLYGTTMYGGNNCGGAGCGAVYAITPAGLETIVYFFNGSQDGANPQSRLIDWNGKLYGTTTVGGAGGSNAGSGTVFSVTPAGAEKVLYSFTGGGDGSYPVGALIHWHGDFYGITQMGGGSAACSLGCGTVFKVTPGGAETILHAFQGGSDGAAPSTGLVESDGVLYGTTESGGAHGSGTVFSVTASGVEKILYSFYGGSDGGGPFGGLIPAPDGFYGTTLSGGHAACGYHQCGTIYHITKTGKEAVVYKFGHAGLRGSSPVGTLLEHGGAFWGVTAYGGSYDYGTVFKWKP
jgi:uncharacterized repeat protein (TIGR03803 family)